MTALPSEPGSLPEGINLAKEECEEVIGHIEEFLKSDMTIDDARDLKVNVSEHSMELSEMHIEEIIRVIMKRSCCERAPEALRLRISSQIAVWRTEC